MRHQFKLLKAYLLKLSDDDLRDLYYNELVSKNTYTWPDSGADMYMWVAKNTEKAEWAILNEIARRWVN